MMVKMMIYSSRLFLLVIKVEYFLFTTIKLYLGVGKSSILLRYTQNQFRKDYNVTIGVEFCSKTVEIDSDTSVKLQIWDTVRIYFIYI